VQYPESTLQWGAWDLKASPAVWVGIFLAIILVMNLLPVRLYGRLEYIFGCLKLIFLVGLIMFNLVISAQQRFNHPSFWTWNSPYGFSSQNITLEVDPTTNIPTHIIAGTTGRFLGFWTALCTTIFSMIGWEALLITAPENADLQRTETVKIASRKIGLRVMTLYVLAVFTVGLNVPYTDHNLVGPLNSDINGGQYSIFIISMVRNHTSSALPKLLCGFFIFSACSTGANALYMASRILHALASIPDAWPQWKPIESLRSRLERTRLGVPMIAVVTCWLFIMIAFLSVKPGQSTVSTGHFIPGQ
jgi:yeast amino acid transporter